jgi:hypothetical protein
MFRQGDQFINRRGSLNENDSRVYEVNTLIGRGAYGTVYSVTKINKLLPVNEESPTQE